MDFEQMMSRKTRASTTVTIVIDHKVIDRLEDARRAVTAARAKAAGAGHDTSPEADWGDDVPAEVVAFRDAEADAAALTVEARDAVQEFRFAAVGRAEYQRILDANQPTAAQRKENQFQQWNYLTFGPALVAACSVEPKLSDEQTRRMWDDANWSTGECARLETACYELLGQARKVELD